MAQQTQKRPREFTGKHMLMVVVGFFSVIIAANLALAWFAAGSWTGLVVPNSYVASQHYNTLLEVEHEQASWGWTSTAGYGRGVLRFELKDADGMHLHAFAVTARVTRPTHEHDDQTIALSDALGGEYKAPVTLAPGVWVIDVEAVSPDGARTYGQAFRIWVPENG